MGVTHIFQKVNAKNLAQSDTYKTVLITKDDVSDDEGKLALTDELLRMFVISDRAGVYGD